MLARTSTTERSHVELITVYEICRILGASLDIARTFRASLNVLAAHLALPRAMIVMAGQGDDDRHILAVGLALEGPADSDRRLLAIGSAVEAALPPIPLAPVAC